MMRATVAYAPALRSRVPHCTRADAPNPNGIPGALIPVPQPHGRVPEVTAPNVDPKYVIFSRTAMADMDAACGPQKVRHACVVPEV